MDLTVRVLCRPEIAAGFELAGLAVDVADETTAGDEMQRLASEPVTGIVLVEDRLRRAIPEDVMRRLDRAGTPIVVFFPSPAWEKKAATDEYVLEILRQAVGYRVKPQ